MVEPPRVVGEGRSENLKLLSLEKDSVANRWWVEGHQELCIRGGGERSTKCCVLWWVYKL